MRLPNDVTRCSSNSCPLAKTCLRRTDQKPDETYWMSMFLPQDGSECDYFTPQRDQNKQA